MNTIHELQAAINKFADDRDWGQFHTPGELARAIMIEAGELNDCHLWIRSRRTQQMCDEMADVLIYCFRYASVSGFDIEQAIKDKLAINAAKYPVDKAKGSNAKSTEL